MRYLSVCSGIEAATQAWHPLGWEPVAFSEIEKFSSAVLDHHYPLVPNLGDMTQFKEWPNYEIDLLVGGTPCQSFSVAGLRAGLDDPRGNLALTFLAIAERYQPRWLVWENVPGVLSSDRGRAFGSILGAMAKLGYGWSYRILDAQYVRTRGFSGAVPQRRRRVFVVAHLGDWRRAAAVLFDAESLRGNPPPGREAGAEIAAPLVSGAPNGSPAHGARSGTAKETSLVPVAHALRGEGFDASEDGTGRGTPIVPEVCGALSDGAHMGGGLNGQDAYSSRIIPGAFAENSRSEVRLCGGDGSVSAQLTTGGGKPGQGQPCVAFHNRQDPDISGDVTHPLGSMDNGMAGAFDMRGREGGAMPEGPHDTANMRAASGGSSRSYIAQPMAVRRLTPVECERLQGFPDNFTRIPIKRFKKEPKSRHYEKYPDHYGPNPDGTWTRFAADGPRYKALGNSMAVNVMQWLGQRIHLVDTIFNTDAKDLLDG